MVICLLRNLGGLTTPSNGWDQLPHPNDTLPGADFATLKWYRNQMAHATVTSMENNEFTDKWTRVEKALTSLKKGQIPHAVTEILNYDLDGEKAKRLAIAELEQMTNEYLESEKEKEQIESDFSYYKDGNLPKNFADANENLVKTWITDNEIFYETKGTKLVYDKVKNCNCILVTSNSGLGKTATIRHIAIKLKLEGFEIVAIESPDDIIKYKTNTKKQVFLIDDVLGKYDLSPTLLEEWERKDKKLISCLETELGSTKILCTLRLQITLSKRFKNASSILKKVVINLEHESNELSRMEKQKILMKHLRRRNLENEIRTKEVEIICENKYAFPLLCKLVSNSEERFRKRIAFFKQPLSLLREELDKISNENEKLYCILVICMLNNGSFSSNIFDSYSNEYDEKIYRIMQTCGLTKNMTTKELKDSARSAIGSYFTKDSYNFRFIHDALEETVGCHFYTFNPTVMLSECDISFITDRIRVHSNENSPEIVSENIVIIMEDELKENHLEPLFNRLCDELPNGRFSSLLMSDLFKNRNFIRLFGITFGNKHGTMKSKNSYLFKNSVNWRHSSYKSIRKKALGKTYDNPNNKDAVSRVIGATYGRLTLKYWIVAFGCHEFFQYAWNKLTKIERKWIMGREYISNPLVKSFFPLAVLGGSFDIVKELISSGADVNCFSEFWETPLYIAVKSGCCKMVRLLVENGAQVNLRGWFKMNIPILVTSNKPELTSLILEHDLNQTELHKAVRMDDLESLRLNFRSVNTDCKTKSGWTVLHYAVLLNNLQAVEQVHKVKVSIADNNGLTAVHLAVLKNNIEILSILLRNKAEVKIRDDFDRTPLHYALSGSATNLLLTHSFRKQCLENTRLIEEGREYDETPMSAFRTMCFNITLHTAFRNVCRDFVNMPDKEGNTPLYFLIKRYLLKEENNACIETLLENGANPYLVNDNGISAYGLTRRSFDTFKYISYRQSIVKYHKVFALVMFFLMGLTLGIAIYMCRSSGSFIRKEFQNECFCVGQVSLSGDIRLLQLTRGIYSTLKDILRLITLRDIVSDMTVLRTDTKTRSKVLKTRPAFSSDNDLAEILKQVEINNARSSLLERLLLKQQETIEKLFAFVTRHLQPQESENTQRISTARRSLIDAVENESDVPSPSPSHSSRLPDIPLTPTTSHITTLEQRNTFSPTFGFNMSTPPMRQSLTVPYSLFSDIPEQFLISENDLSRAIHSSKGPGNFACHIMPFLFPELFTSDNLRTMYTFYGGGKLDKNPLNRQKREFLRRYVVTVFPEVMCDKAFNERVLSKVNQLLRRPVHRK
ncbi:unnamed protein product [Mytilus coruscus]|uniref:BEN domain-containing protein n=1 Tax=Mytilus coruscus TaxID=42192 RepID=A0A6J8AUE8_MYTCO|nr:unnamed protein product [Mytilus coruscus]